MEEERDGGFTYLKSVPFKTSKKNIIFALFCDLELREVGGGLDLYFHCNTYTPACEHT